jgi:lipopolysaccharide transport system ATP-binding protein
LSTVIKIENVSKQYKLGSIGTSTLKGDLQRWWYGVRGLPDPTLIIGQENNLSTSTSTSTSDFVWALKDINFEVKQGDVLGIIGKNGAGKSTLLKLLSRVTAPTTGSIKVKGRIASLLEVGTGFHPELTGRENIFLNGAILGMTKTEIRNKFDEIVDFAGVAKYIDTPVKRYSSGMYVRLAFAVAAYLEPEILIVDEVLAVGDAEFQKKAIGKMQDVSRNEGRTVIFVSHNMLAVKTLCKSGILLNNGIIQSQGEISKVIDNYISINKTSSYSIIEKESNGFIVHTIRAIDNGVEGNFNIENDLEIKIEVSSLNEQEQININLFFNTQDGALIFATCSSVEKFEKGKATYICVIPERTLNDNTYLIDIMVVYKSEIVIHDIRNAIILHGNEGRRSAGWLGKFPGLIRPQYFRWSKISVNEEF